MNSPLVARSRRRVLRVPSRQSIFAIARRASAISSGVNWAKSFLRSISRALKTRMSSGRGFQYFRLRTNPRWNLPPRESPVPWRFCFRLAPRRFAFPCAPAVRRRAGAACRVRFGIAVAQPAASGSSRAARTSRTARRTPELFGRINQRGPGRVIEVHSPPAIDFRDRVDKADDLPAADSQPRVAQIAAEGKQIRLQANRADIIRVSAGFNSLLH